MECDIGCRNVTLETEPEPLRMVKPTCRLRAKWRRDSTTSFPAEISITTAFMADSFSLVITIGGFGLFFDPGGLPRGFLPTLSTEEERRFLGFAAERGRWSEEEEEEEEEEVRGWWEREIAPP